MMNLTKHIQRFRVYCVAAALLGCLAMPQAAFAEPQMFELSLRNQYGQVPQVGVVTNDPAVYQQEMIEEEPGRTAYVSSTGAASWQGEPGSSLTLYGQARAAMPVCTETGVPQPQGFTVTVTLGSSPVAVVIPTMQALVTPEYSATEDEIVAQINAERVATGAPAVQKDDRLTYAADSHVYWQDRFFQTQTQTSTHCGDNHSDVRNRAEEWGLTGVQSTGEILAGAPVGSAGSAYMQQWNSSTTHAAILRDPQYQWVGVGVSKNTGRAVVTFAKCAAPTTCGQAYAVPPGAIIQQDVPTEGDTETETETEGNDGVMAVSRFASLSSRLYATKTKAGVRWHLVTRGRAMTDRGAVRFKNVVVAARKGAKRTPLGVARTNATGHFAQHEIVAVPKSLRKAPAAKQRAWIIAHYGRMVEARYAGDDATRRSIRTAKIGA